MMALINAMVVGASAVAAMAVADDSAVPREMQELLDHGFEVVAEGQLQDTIECQRLTLRVIPQAIPDTCKQKLGSFRRLKGGSEEFVCVSFRGWACYQSQNIDWR